MAPCKLCSFHGCRLYMASLESQGGAPALQDSELVGFLFEAFEGFLLPAVLVRMLHRNVC